MTFKSALVTGADGFIGSHLTEMLLLQGVKVKALALNTHLIIGVGSRIFYKIKTQ